MNKPFDPTLLYAECRRCGSPVLGVGNPSEVLLWLGVPLDLLDADCLLLYDGCPNCSPGQTGYESNLVRLGGPARRPAVH